LFCAVRLVCIIIVIDIMFFIFPFILRSLFNKPSDSVFDKSTLSVLTHFDPRRPLGSHSPPPGGGGANTIIVHINGLCLKRNKQKSYL
jgi:hypothetical protein